MSNQEPRLTKEALEWIISDLNRQIEIATEFSKDLKTQLERSDDWIRISQALRESYLKLLGDAQ